MIALVPNDTLRLRAWEKVNRTIAIADCRYAIVVAEDALKDAKAHLARVTSPEYHAEWREWRELLAKTDAMSWGSMRASETYLGATSAAEKRVKECGGDLALQESRLEALLGAQEADG